MKILVVSANQNLTISLPIWLIFEDVMNNILASKKVKVKYCQHFHNETKLDL